MRRVLFCMILLMVFCWPLVHRASAAPRVVASIKPVHALVAGVMKGVGEPRLLLKGAASPHTFALKPSDAKAIEDARLIFWVGEALAPPLARPFRVIPKGAKVVALADVKVPGLKRLEFRKGGLWEAHDHDHDDHREKHDHDEEKRGHEHDKEKHAHDKEKHAHDEEKHAHGEEKRGHEHDKEKHAHDKEKHAHDEEKHAHGEEKRGHDRDGEKHAHGEKDHHDDEHAFDPHLWLDPLNASLWAGVIARELGEADPGNREKYEANARRLKARLDALHRELRGALAPVGSAPYIVFHDAYQYLEERYGLNAVGSVSASPEKKPGAARLAELRAKIRGSKSICVFSEPQFRPGAVTTIIRGTGARAGELDPLGARIPAGEDAYFTLMRGLAQSLRTCLLGSR